MIYLRSQALFTLFYGDLLSRKPVHDYLIHQKDTKLRSTFGFCSQYQNHNYSHVSRLMLASQIRLDELDMNIVIHKCLSLGCSGLVVTSIFNKKTTRHSKYMHSPMVGIDNFSDISQIYFLVQECIVLVCVCKWGSLFLNKTGWGDFLTTASRILSPLVAVQTIIVTQVLSFIYLHPCILFLSEMFTCNMSGRFWW